MIRRIDNYRFIDGASMDAIKLNGGDSDYQFSDRLIHMNSGRCKRATCRRWRRAIRIIAPSRIDHIKFSDKGLQWLAC